MIFQTPGRPRTRAGSLFFAVTLAALASAIAGACTKDEGIQAEHDAGVTPTADATADTAPPDAKSDVSLADLGCPNSLPGAALVRVETPGNVYCMDQREVSWGEYKAFIAAKGGDTSGQPKECAWNTSFEPEYYAVDSGTEVDPTHKCPIDAQPASDDFAANCLDFCDAHAYCEWAGKRLCGRIGGANKWPRVDVGAPTFAEKQALSDVAASADMEFGNVCTQGAESAYAYGSVYEPGRCMDPAWVAQKGKESLTITDISNRTCHGITPPFNQLYDLNGSVEEWQNLCWTDEAGMSCLHLSDHWAQQDSARQSCAGGVAFPVAKEKNPWVGLRCCTDGVPIGRP